MSNSNNTNFISNNDNDNNNNITNHSTRTDQMNRNNNHYNNNNNYDNTSNIQQQQTIHGFETTTTKPISNQSSSLINESNNQQYRNKNYFQQLSNSINNNNQSLISESTTPLPSYDMGIDIQNNLHYYNHHHHHHQQQQHHKNHHQYQRQHHKNHHHHHHKPNQNLSSQIITPIIPSAPQQSSSSVLYSSSNSLLGDTNRLNILYVYELPYNIRKSICDLLDADNTWRELGGRYMGFNDTQLTLISHALYRSASPTNELLTKWESSNAKISHLFIYLSKMKHHRALYYLLPYVNKKLRSFYYEQSKQDINNIDQTLNNIDINYNRQSKLNEDFLPLSSSLLPSELSSSSTLIPSSLLLTKSSSSSTSSSIPFPMKVSSVPPPLSSSPTLISKTTKLPKTITTTTITTTTSTNTSSASTSKSINILKDLKNVKQQVSNDQLSSKTLINLSKKSKYCQNVDDKNNYLLKIDDFKITYKELVIATDDFSKDNILGSGGFGTVYIGEWKGTKVAIKKLKGLDNLTQALTELRILNCCRIDNILPLYAVSLDGPEPCLVYQYMPNGSLEDRLLCKNNTAPLTWIQRGKIGEGVARALNFLHTLKGNPFVHGDVKSANILLDQMFEPKLGDFGLARQVIKNNRNENSIYTHCTVSSVNGTSVYLPAEYLRQKILSPAVDVYSYGIVILEMATGRRAYDGKKLLINSVEDEYSKVQNNQSLNIYNKNHNNNNHQQNYSIKSDNQKQYSFNENTLEFLMDKRIVNQNEGRHLFYYLLELGRRCAHKTKSKRPIMIQILEYYNQCRSTERIYKLCDKVIQNKLAKNHNNNNKQLLSKIDLKNPIELQLWYDFVLKSCGTTLSEIVFENFDAQVTKIIEDLVSKDSNESTYYLDLLLCSKNRINTNKSLTDNNNNGDNKSIILSSSPSTSISSSKINNNKDDNKDSDVKLSTKMPSASSSPSTSTLSCRSFTATSLSSSTNDNKCIDNNQLSNVSINFNDNNDDDNDLKTINNEIDNDIDSVSCGETLSEQHQQIIDEENYEEKQEQQQQQQYSTPFIPLLTALGFDTKDLNQLINAENY